eukprot:5932354-Amphidinium_carterae.1
MSLIRSRWIPRRIQLVIFVCLVRNKCQMPLNKLRHQNARQSILNCVFVASDAAFANVDQVSSQAGYVIGIRCGADFHMWDCSSCKIRRVCRSTLGAEANALVEGAQYADYCRQVAYSLLLSGLPLSVPAFMDIPVQWFTDSKSFYDVLTVDTTLVNDKRLRIVVAQLRQLCQEGDVALAWIDTQLMLADSLTKLEVADMYFKECISSLIGSTACTEQTLARNAQLQAQPRERKRVLKLTKAETLLVYLVDWCGSFSYTKVVPSKTTQALDQVRFQRMPWLLLLLVCTLPVQLQFVLFESAVTLPDIALELALLCQADFQMMSTSRCAVAADCQMMLASRLALALREWQRLYHSGSRAVYAAGRQVPFNDRGADCRYVYVGFANPPFGKDGCDDIMFWVPHGVALPYRFDRGPP